MKRISFLLAFAVSAIFPVAANAQSSAQPVVPGLLTVTGCPGGATPCFVQNSPSNPLYTSPASGGSPSNVNVQQVGGVAVGAGGIPTGPGTRTIVPLDVSTVTTGGTAVTALTAGHRTAGGFLLNPVGATINLCINEQGTASGTTSAGALTCIVPGQEYNLTPAAGAVSVVTSDSAHPFSGYGLN